ncbi:Arabinose 5-phosphate isomerase KdsD [Thiorhodovibrio winogradskyi]|uniref:Arabinose 5-phosphate isomerase KdsD n=1 Tax=Thiorhodovibrio winogradskyi TaxID=77007 RepID=A0ABZ0S8I4_9GAMM|nr:CBS domain-containing protein [Thiorhodovibrio winogradskyi]
MKIKNLMSSPVVTVEMDDSLAVVKEIFDNTHFHHLAVLEEGRLYGVLSDRDLFKAISPGVGTPAESNQDRAALSRRAHQIMSRRPVVIEQEQDVRDALRLFEDHHVACLPVVDGDENLVGILTWRDLLHTMRSLLA